LWLSAGENRAVVGQDRRRDREVIVDLLGLLPPESRTVPVELSDPVKRALRSRRWRIFFPIITGHFVWPTGYRCWPWPTVGGWVKGFAATTSNAASHEAGPNEDNHHSPPTM
jgi:hypothetical protein